jgi:predicted nucleic acid-binding protein
MLGGRFSNRFPAHDPHEKIFALCEVSVNGRVASSASPRMTRTDAELRADHKLPYTDCFAAALAALRKATLATSDQGFATVEKKIDILWTTS